MFLLYMPSMDEPKPWLLLASTLLTEVQSTTITHTVCHTLRPYYEITVIAGTVILCVTLKNQLTQVRKACI